MPKENGYGSQKKSMRVENMSRIDEQKENWQGCCIYCGHCDDEVIEMMTECKCHCHSRGGNTSLLYMNRGKK